MKNLHNNIRKLYAFSFLQMMLFPMAIITLFWKDHIGLTLAQILLLQSIFSLATIVLDYPAGYVSDRLGYRVALTIASLFGIAGWGIYTVAASFADVLLAEILLGISYSFISGSDSALLYETLRAEGKEQLYARFDGRMNGFAQGGEALGAVFAGVIYAAAPLLPFFLQVAVWIAALGVTRQMVETPRESAVPGRSHLAAAVQTARYAFLDNRHLRYTILLNMLLGIASFFPVCAMASHRMHGRLGDRRMVVLFVTLIAAGYFGLGMIGGLWGFLFYYLLTGMRGLRGPMMLTHTQAESPSANRAAVLSLQSVSFRLFFACTGPFVGKLADAVGVQRTFHLLFYAFLVALPPLAVLFMRSCQGRKSA